MNRNELKIALRNLWRNRTFSLLNVLGLSVGIATCLVMFLLIRFERSFDTFHSKRDRIYQVTSSWSGGAEGKRIFQGVPIPLAGALRQEFPQFERVAAVYGVIHAQFTLKEPGGEEKKIKETNGVFYAEPDFFDIFDFPWLEGNPLTALRDPNTMAIDQTTAEAWFGSWESAVGKTILLDHETPVTITGILKDAPANTDLPLRIVLSYATFPDRNDKNWHSTNGISTCYALLATGQSITQVQVGVKRFAKKYFGAEDVAQEGSSLFFEPIKELHLDSRLGTYTGKRAPVELLWALGVIGFLLLLVACINFINLSTAQSITRAKEIGVRKVLGSSRRGLVWQFLVETGVIAFFALGLACIMSELILPWLRSLTGMALYLDLWHQPTILIFLTGIWMVVTLLAGFYPGIVLSGFDPVDAIQSKSSRKTGRGAFLRRGLVVAQFTIAQLLLIGTIVLVRQIGFIRSRPLGFDKNAIVTLDLPTDSLSQQKLGFLKEKVLGIPGVLNASLCSDAPFARRVLSTSFTFDNRPANEEFGMSLRLVDTDYFRTFRIPLVSGRLPYPKDSLHEILLNETAVRKLGFPDMASVLGKTVSIGGPHSPVVGVVKDFNSSSPEEALKPMALFCDPTAYEHLAIRFDINRMKSTLDQVAGEWDGVFPEYAYTQHFLDDTLAQSFDTSEKLALLFKIFAGIALFVSCLGLYGLVAFMAVQKVKEVGIRKVLGASVGNIVLLFSREFTVLVTLAFVIAAPVGYMVMHELLNNFYYRTGIGWDIFGLTVGISVLIAWITVGYRAIRAAMANPVRALKHE